MSVCLPCKGSESQLEGSECWLEESEGLSARSEGQPEGSKVRLEGSEGLPEGPEGLPEGPEGRWGQMGTDGQTYRWIDGRTEFLPILQEGLRAFWRGLRACWRGLRACQEARGGWRDGHTNGKMDRLNFSPFYRTLFSLGAAALLHSATSKQQRSRAREPLTI